MRKFLWLALLVFAIPLAFVGCSSSDDDGGSADVVGTWALTQSNDGSSMYIDFNDNGSFVMKDCLDCGAHMTGTYTVNGNRVAGPLVNPGIGEGEIVATVDGNSITLDFIEHWHNPYKHVPYTGSKL